MAKAKKTIKTVSASKTNKQISKEARVEERKARKAAKIEARKAKRAAKIEARKAKTAAAKTAKKAKGAKAKTTVVKAKGAKAKTARTNGKGNGHDAATQAIIADFNKSIDAIHVDVKAIEKAAKKAKSKKLNLKPFKKIHRFLDRIVRA